MRQSKTRTNGNSTRPGRRRDVAYGGHRRAGAGHPDQRQPAAGREALELGSDVQRLPRHRSQVLPRLEREPAEQGPDLHAHRRAPPCEPRHRAGRRPEPAAEREQRLRGLDQGLARRPRASPSTTPRTPRPRRHRHGQLQGRHLRQHQPRRAWKHGTAISPTAAVNTTTSAYLDAAKVDAAPVHPRAAAASSRSTTRSAPSTTGRGTRACSGTRTSTTTARARTARSTSSARPTRRPPACPRRSAFNDEWYNLVPYPTNVKFLATVDESTLARQGRESPGPRQLPPGRLVPVLRRRPRLADDAGPRHAGLPGWFGLPRPGRIQEAHRARHQVGNGPDAFLPVARRQG